MTVLEAFVHDPLVEWTKVSPPPASSPFSGTTFNGLILILVETQERKRRRREGSGRKELGSNQEEVGGSDPRKGD
jgi:hypothetical protein